MFGGLKKPLKRDTHVSKPAPVTRVHHPNIWQRQKVFIISFAFLATLALMIAGLWLWAWYGSLEESVPGMGQMVPEAKMRRIAAPISGVVTKVHVRENQEVKKGQVLMELDPETTRAETAGVEEQLSLLNDEANALRAAVANGGYNSQGSINTVQDAWLSATREAYRAQEAEARIVIERSQHNLKQAMERENQAREVLKASEQLLVNYERLHNEGGLSGKEYQEFLQRVNAQRGELLALSEGVKVAQAELAQAKERPSQLSGGYQRDLLTRLSEHQLNIARLRTDREKTTILLAHQTIVSPVDGVVHEQIVRGPGDVVSAGQPVISIVPSGTKMVAEVRVTNRDLSYIHLGQRAALRLDAFPYQHFGRLYGTVEAISPSTVEAAQPQPNSAVQAPMQSAMPFYVITIRPDKSIMTYQGKSYPIRSGMTVSADLITRKKNIFSFFSEPIQFHIDKAFRDPTNR